MEPRRVPVLHAGRQGPDQAHRERVDQAHRAVGRAVPAGGPGDLHGLDHAAWGRAGTVVAPSLQGEGIKCAAAPRATVYRTSKPRKRPRPTTSTKLQYMATDQKPTWPSLHKSPTSN